MSNVPSTTAASAWSSSQYTYSAATATYFPTPFHLQQTPTPPPAPYIGAAPPPSFALPVYPAPPTVDTLPQYQQAQQLFQRDAQTITPEALESVKAALANSDIKHKAETNKKAIPRKAAGQTWEDPTLAEWPGNDYRLFCGNLGHEVNDDVLAKAFARFPSFNMARVVRDKRAGKTKALDSSVLLTPQIAWELRKKWTGNMSEIAQLSFGRVDGPKETIPMLWEDKSTILRRRLSSLRKVSCTNEAGQHGERERERGR